MGVSGFLISCAMRRATSDHAALRCADCRAVISSNVIIIPCPSSISSRAILKIKLRRPLCADRTGISLRMNFFVFSLRIVSSSGTTSKTCRPVISRDNSATAALFARFTIPRSSTPITARRHTGQNRFNQTPPVVDLPVRGDQFTALALDPAGHAVEGLRQIIKLFQPFCIRHAGR